MKEINPCPKCGSNEVRRWQIISPRGNSFFFMRDDCLWFNDTEITVWRAKREWNKVSATESEGMLPLSYEEAVSFYEAGFAVYALYEDGTESLIESEQSLQTHEGIFGFEIGKESLNADENI